MAAQTTSQRKCPNGGIYCTIAAFAKLQHLNLSWWHYYEPAQAGPALRDWHPSTSQHSWRPANLWCDLSGAKCNVLQVTPAQQDTEWMSEGAECSSCPRNQSPITSEYRGLCSGGYQPIAPQPVVFFSFEFHLEDGRSWSTESRSPAPKLWNTQAKWKGF